MSGVTQTTESALIAAIAAQAANINQIDLASKPPCRAATTANITLSGTQTIDGIAVVAGNRVLVKDQTLGATNGIYVVAAGAWTRATDFATSTQVKSGLHVHIQEGTKNGSSTFQLTTIGDIVLGITSLTFSLPYRFGASTSTGETRVNDLVNDSYIRLVTAEGHASIQAGYTTTGEYRPIYFSAGGANRVMIPTTGGLDVLSVGVGTDVITEVRVGNDIGAWGDFGVASSTHSYYPGFIPNEVRLFAESLAACLSLASNKDESYIRQIISGVELARLDHLGFFNAVGGFKINGTSIFARENTWTAAQNIINASTDPTFAIGEALTGGLYGLLQWNIANDYLRLTTGGVDAALKIQDLGGATTVGGSLAIVGAFGCNGATAKTAYASGGALSAYGTGAFGFDSDAHAQEIHTLLTNVRAALVANGIMS